MSNNRFVKGYPGAGTGRDTLLFDNRRLADIPFPLGANLEGKAVARSNIPAEPKQVKPGWNIKHRNLGGVDIAYEMPVNRVDGLTARTLILGVGGNADEVNRGNVTKYNVKNGVNLSAGDLRYQNKFGNGAVNFAVNGPGVELGYDATGVYRKIWGGSLPTGFAAGARAKATILTGEADGRIEFPIRKTFTPFWKIPSNIVGVLRGERKAGPGDLKLVLSGGGEGGTALGGDAFLRVGEYAEGMTPGMSRDPGAKVRHGFGVKGGLSFYPATGWGVGGRAGISIEQEPEEAELASPYASGPGNGPPQSEAPRLLFDPAPYGPEQAFTPIDEPLEDTSHFNRSQSYSGSRRLPMGAAKLLFDPTPHGPEQMFTPIDEPDEDFSHFNGASANRPVAQTPYVLLPREANGAGNSSSSPDRLEQLRRAFWLLSRDNGR